MHTPDFKVAQEVAEQEFDRLCAMWDLDAAPTDMNDNEKASFSVMKKKIVSLIMQGRAVVDDNKEAFKYTLSKQCGSISEISFTLPSGGAFEKVDKCKDSEDVKRNNTIIAAMIGQPLSVVQNLGGVDYKVARTISSLFMSL